MTDHLGHRPEPELGHELADLLGDELEERLDELRLAAEAGAELGVLRGDTDRAGVQVADAHHDAARHDERGRCEPVLLGAEQRCDDDVASGLHLTVGLHDDPIPQPVQQQGLLGLCEAQFPGSAGMLERGERTGAGTAVVTGDQHDVRLGLRHTRSNGSDATLGDQLHVHAGIRVGVLQIVDQLLEILDRVDVVMRWRADESDAGRRVAGRCDPRVHLVTRQLPALARLRPLRHLDLQVVGVGEVLRGHPEPARCDLLDRRAALRVVQPVDVLAALARVRLRAEMVHRDGQRLVRLGRDRAVAHRAGGEPLDDLADGFHLVEGNRLACRW